MPIIISSNESLPTILTKYSEGVEYFKHQADGPRGCTHETSSPTLVGIAVLQPSSLKILKLFKK